MGTQLEAAFLRHRLPEDDAVWVADRDEHRFDASRRRFELHLLWFAVEVGGQVCGAKRWPSDVQLGDDLGAVPREDLHGVRPVDRAELEPVGRPVLEHGVGGGDAQPVAALLGLGPVGVEDTHAHRRRVEGEQPVGAQAPVAVAELRQQGDQVVKRSRQVQDHVVVAQRLVLDQVYLRHCRKLSGISHLQRGLPTIDRLWRT